MRPANDGVGHAVKILDRRMHALHHALEALLTFGRRVPELACERADVAARHEMLAGAAQDDDAQRIVVRNFRCSRDQRFDHREIERVEDVGTVERERRDGTSAIEQDRFAHGKVQSSMRHCPIP